MLHLKLKSPADGPTSQSDARSRCCRHWGCFCRGGVMYRRGREVWLRCKALMAFRLWRYSMARYVIPAQPAIVLCPRGGGGCRSHSAAPPGVLVGLNGMRGGLQRRPAHVQQCVGLMRRGVNTSIGTRAGLSAWGQGVQERGWALHTNERSAIDMRGLCVVTVRSPAQNGPTGGYGTAGSSGGEGSCMASWSDWEADWAGSLPWSARRG